MNKILLAYDGSEESKKALQEVKRIGFQNKSEVTVLSVAAQSDIANIESGVKRYVEDIHKALLEESKNLLEIAVKEFADYPFKVDAVNTMGKPGAVIVEYASENNIDLIVMGSRGLGAVKRTFLGSVSNYVLNHTEKSVYIVR